MIFHFVHSLFDDVDDFEVIYNSKIKQAELLLSLNIYAKHANRCNGYKRCELIMDNTKYIKSIEAETHDTLPAYSPYMIPFCRLYNSTNSIPRDFNIHLSSPTLLTFSFHLFHDCLQIYFYISSNGKCYGSRLFANDLLTVIPSLFEDNFVDTSTQNRLTRNQECSKIFEKYKSMLYKQNGKLNVYENDSKEGSDDDNHSLLISEQCKSVQSTETSDRSLYPLKQIDSALGDYYKSFGDKKLF